MDMNKVLKKVKDKSTPPIIEKAVKSWVTDSGVNYKENSVAVFQEIAKLGYYFGIKVAQKKQRNSGK